MYYRIFSEHDFKPYFLVYKFILHIRIDVVVTAVLRLS